MTFDDVKPGFYFYAFGGRGLPWEIDVYKDRDHWVWGKGDDCGNSLTEDMLPHMTWSRPFSGKPELIIPADYQYTPEQYAKWTEEMWADWRKAHPDAGD